MTSQKSVDCAELRFVCPRVFGKTGIDQTTPGTTNNAMRLGKLAKCARA
jgi:hypothetical protein